ncbi:MAG: glycosyltransferase [Rubrobacter sp.]
MGAGGSGIDGGFFRLGGERFYVRGVTYGTFAEGELGLYPDLEQVRLDFAAMVEANINTVRTYTVPDRAVFDLAEEFGLKLLVGVWWDDPRFLDQPTKEAWNSMAAEAKSIVRQAAEVYGEHPAVLGFVLGNEIPASSVRWHGARRVEGLLRGLYEAGKAAAPDALFSYANYPTTEYLDTSYFDFDCFNVFLEDESAYRRYLAQLQIDAGDRPLILTELGLDSASNGEWRQAEVLDWQLRGAVEYGLAGACVFSWTDDWWVGGNKVEGWGFGLTSEEREPKAALGVVSRHFEDGLLGSRTHWPRASVVVCAYQAEETLQECLRSLMDLSYPDYEVLVVDDGSTDATAELACAFPVRLLSERRLGISGARNLGLSHASGEVVAYIDADAQADEDWLTYLVVALETPGTAGAGGPNLPPPEDPPVAQCVARAPGGPIHVLLDNEHAEHVPGCNMAFWRESLVEIGGFDPVYRAAGDDVDVCWKLQDLGYGIRFHAAAIVWHHPRDRIMDFWRQQVGYGKAEALVVQNHPDKFNALGQAMWRGMVYGPTPFLPGRSYIYSGRFGEAPFQRLYRTGSAFGVWTGLYLIAGMVVLALLAPFLLPLPAAGAMALLATCLWHGVNVARQERLRPSWLLGSVIGLLYLLQPLARETGRLRYRHLSYPAPFELKVFFQALRPLGRRVFFAEYIREGDRPAYLEELRDKLRARFLNVRSAPAWEESDLVCDSKLFWRARIVSHVHRETLYVRLGYEPRVKRLLVAVLAIALASACWPNLVGETPVFTWGRVLWSPGFIEVAIPALVGAFALERGWFGLRMRRGLTADKA